MTPRRYARRSPSIAVAALLVMHTALAQSPAPTDQGTAPANVQPSPRVADQLKAAPPVQLPPLRPVPAPQMAPAPATPAAGGGKEADCKPVTGGEVCGGVFYQGGRGARTTVGVNPVPKVDLQIIKVEWLQPQPLSDSGDFLKAVETGARMATVGPRLFLAVGGAVQRGLTTTVGPQQRSTAVESVVVSPVIRVRVRNAGRERWASRGEVDVRIRPGTAEQESKHEPATVVPVPGLRPNPAVAGAGYANRLGQIVSRGAIAGSLGPGEEKDVQIAFLHGLHHPVDRLARYRYLFDVDKWYTAEVNLLAEQDDRPGNNAVRAQFRLDPHGGALEMRQMPVRPNDERPIRASAAPGSR